MGLRGLGCLLFFGAICLEAQTVCGPTPAFSPCEVVFDLSQADFAAHPNPYKTLELHAEFRSPRHRTFLLPAFWDGGQRMVIRFTPTEAGDWDFRVTSNIASFNGKVGQFSATASDAPGFVRAANVHHFAYTAGDGNTPHLWMGDTLMRLAMTDDAAFDSSLMRARRRSLLIFAATRSALPKTPLKPCPPPRRPTLVISASSTSASATSIRRASPSIFCWPEVKTSYRSNFPIGSNASRRSTVMPF